MSLFVANNSDVFRGGLDSAFRNLIQIALIEDIGSGDITTSALGNLSEKIKQGTGSTVKRMGRGEVVVKDRQIVICGLQVATLLFGNGNGLKKKGRNQLKKKHTSTSPQYSDSKSITCHRQDGERVIQGEKILTIVAPIEELLGKERILLNFLQHLCGIATLTRIWADALKKSLGDGVHLLDTRKTLPGYRVLEKYAVHCGGGLNHRMGLYDHYLIKDNHIQVAQGPVAALERILAHKSRSKRKLDTPPRVEIECRNLEEVREVVQFNHRSSRGVDVIMLDNFSIQGIKAALKIIDNSCQVEISGNIDLNKIKKLASLKKYGRDGKCGIHYVSAGSLTHSAKVADLSMSIEYV